MNEPLITFLWTVQHAPVRGFAPATPDPAGVTERLAAGIPDRLKSGYRHAAASTAPLPPGRRAAQGNVADRSQARRR